MDETQHVHKYEALFQSVREVSGHGDLEKVVNDFTAKDEENFSRLVIDALSQRTLATVSCNHAIAICIIDKLK